MAKLSDGDMQEIQEVVGIFDRVGDGKVDVNDIVNILRSLGEHNLFFMNLEECNSVHRA